jgi:hypothetical protein
MKPALIDTDILSMFFKGNKKVKQTTKFTLMNIMKLILVLSHIMKY